MSRTRRLITMLALLLTVGGVIGYFLHPATYADSDSGRACYVTVHPQSRHRDTVWVCYRLRDR